MNKQVLGIHKQEITDKLSPVEQCKHHATCVQTHS